MLETGARYISINKNFWKGITVIDLALATLAMGIPAIIVAATIGSKLELNW